MRKGPKKKKITLLIVQANNMYVHIYAKCIFSHHMFMEFIKTSLPVWNLMYFASSCGSSRAGDFRGAEL